MIRPFEFVAGSLALDFVDTLAGRAKEPAELLAEPGDLVRWFREARLVHSIILGEAELAAARELRETIHATVLAVVEDIVPSVEAVARINSAAAKPDLRPQYVNGDVVLHAQNPLEAALSRIAADAINDLSPAMCGRLRRCPDCKMLFRDNSRPGKRKWCSSASGCGNRAKVRRHRARHKGIGKND